ncbi:MAG: DUF1513 domain-containing protein [Methylobacteriaceae bacterium]|nr:DUF1513 domain-containing protein [Methylobacteriaceae bacterium]
MSAPRPDRRGLLKAAGLGLAGAALASCAGAEPVSLAAEDRPAPPRALRDIAVYVPGYMPEKAFANGRPVTRHRRLARGVADPRQPCRMLSRIGLDGSVRQAVLPAFAHDVEVAPDRSVGVLCGFEARDHVAFDPQTLDLVAVAPSFGEGWRGGGHAVFLDGGRMLALSERAPRFALGREGLEAHYGRITLRDPRTLKIRESYSSHGVDPHDIRLIEDGRYLVVANYGSLPRAGESQLPVPREVTEACVTIIDMASGKLVDKQVTGRADTELRHLAAGSRQRIFAIQARLGDPQAGAAAMSEESVAYEADLTGEEGLAYLAAPTLKLSQGAAAREMGGRRARAGQRHGLSIVYDSKNDQAIASFPSSHRIMVFDGASGDVARDIDTSRLGLRYPCGITLLPDGAHYAVAGYWENLFVFERGAHRLQRDLCLYPTFFGHSHVTSA